MVRACLNTGMNVFMKRLGHWLSKIDDQHTVQMVDLVLQNPRQQAVSPEANLFPRQIPPFDFNVEGPLDIDEHIGKAEAAFGHDLGTAPLGDLRVDNHDRAIPDVRDDDAVEDAHLGRCQTDAPIALHQEMHVAREVS